MPSNLKKCKTKPKIEFGLKHIKIKELKTFYSSNYKLQFLAEMDDYFSKIFTTYM